MARLARRTRANDKASSTWRGLSWSGCLRLLLLQPRSPDAPRRRLRRRRRRRRRRRPPQRCPSRARAQAAIWHLRLRFRRHGQERRAGRRFLRICERHLGEEHADPAPTSRAMACSTSLDDLSKERTRDDHRGAGEGPEQQDRQRLRELHGSGRGRGEGPGAVRAVAERGPRDQVEEGPAEALCRRRSARHRHPVPHVRRPGPQGVRPLRAERAAGRARDARPRLLSLEPIPSWSRPRPNISSI